MDINPSQIKDIFKQATSRIAIATSNGGEAGEVIAFRANGQRYQGRCAQKVGRGECLALQENSGKWWLVNAQAIPDNNRSSRQLSYIRQRPNQPQPREPVPIGASLFFFVWANSEQYYYVIGAHQENPVIWYQEPSASALLPSVGVPGASAVRGIGYGGDWEVACHFTDTPSKKMVAYAPMEYQTFIRNSDPSFQGLIDSLYTTSVAIRGAILRAEADKTNNDSLSPVPPSLPAGTEIAQMNKLLYDNHVGLINKQTSEVLDTRKSFLDQFDNPTPTTVGYKDFNYNWRQVGGGYKIGTLLLQTRVYGLTTRISNSLGGFNTNLFTTFESGTIYAVYEGAPYHVEIPEQYHYKVPYYQINDAGTAMELVEVTATVSKNKYSYSLPLSQTGGRLPLRTPTVTCEMTPVSNPSEVKYEGESYYWIGSEKTYLTEYYHLDTANGIEERKFRHYSGGKYVGELYESGLPAFAAANATSIFGFGPGIPNFDLSIQQPGDIVSLGTEYSSRGLPQAVVAGGLNIVGRRVRCVSHKTNEEGVLVAYTAYGVVRTVTSQPVPFPNTYRVSITVEITATPATRSFLQSSTSIFGGMERSSYIISDESDLSSFINSTFTDIIVSTQGRVLTTSIETGGLWGRGSIIMPFDPSDPDYLKNLVDNNQLLRTFYDSDATVIGSPYSRMDANGLSPFRSPDGVTLDYLRSSWSHLRGNKAYKFHILNKTTLGYDRYLDDDGSNLNLLRGQTGISPTHACYVESWTFRPNGRITLDSKTWELPVYGVRTDVGMGSDYYFNDILDIDIVFSDR